MLRSGLKNYLKLLAFCAGLVVGGWSCPALSATEIVLVADQSSLVRLPKTPATVIVGNPAVADVTMDGSTLFLHPKAYGLTNVVVLDDMGKKLGDYLVRVIFDDRYSVSMFSPQGRETYTCPKNCEPTLRIGDESEFFNDFQSQAQSKNSLAGTQAMGEDLLVPRTTTVITTSSTGALPAP